MKKIVTKMKKTMQSQRGSEILQVILIAGVLLVLIITLFYPQMEKLFTDLMTTISNWFTNTGSEIFKG